MDHTSPLSDELTLIHLTLDALNAGLTLSDRNGRFIVFNAMMEQITGYTWEEANASENFLALLYPESFEYQVALARLHALERTHQFHDLETTIRAKDGALKTLLVTTSLLSFQEQEWYLSVYRDAGERKRANAAIRESLESIRRAKQEWETTADSLVELICLVDRDDGIIRANRTVEQWGLGKVAELKGQRIHRLFHPQCRQPDCPLAHFFCDAWKRLEQHLPTVTELQDPLLARYISIQVRPISSSYWQDQEPSESFAVVIVHDISEPKRLEANLRDANKALIVAHEEAKHQAKEAEMANEAKSAFLAAMSHDIRTPMNSIIGITELVLDTDLSQEQREYVNIVQSSSQSLLKLLNDILDFSKIEAGELMLEQSSFNLESSVATIANMLAAHAHHKDIELLWEIEPTVPLGLIGDPLRLQEIITNLIGNAIKFTRRGEIELKVSLNSSAAEETEGKHTASLHFSVRDTGIGISQEKQHKIFNAFQQADAATSREYGGTGLGLAIATNLVKLMRGRLWVESQRGEGSIFHFTAQFGIKVPCETRPTFPHQIDLDLNDTLALIIDDNSASRALLTKILHSWGMQVHEADNGETGLERIQTANTQGARYELILLDAQMPDISGFDVLHRLQGDSITKRTILMLTNHTSWGKKPQIHSFGLGACIMKPINPSALFDLIVSILGKFAYNKGDGQAILHAPVFLPGATDLPEFSEENGSAAEQKDFPALHILLAEDNAINQMVVEKWLHKRGWTMTIAQNGLEVLDILKQKTFDLILMDIQMPKLDGMSTTKTIREQEEQNQQHIPIIALTAHAMEGDRDRFLDAGMDAYVAKPLKSNQLYAAIEACVKQYPIENPTDGAAAPSAQEPLLDFDELLSSFDHDATFVQELVTTYLRQSSPEILQNIQYAVKNHDSDLLEKAAHRLKGASAVVGAKHIYTTASRLEQMGREQQLSGTDQTLNVLTQQMHALEQFVDQHLDGYVS